MSISIQPIIEKNTIQGEPSARQFIETKLNDDRRIELELQIEEIKSEQNPYKFVTGGKIKQGISSASMGLGGLLSMFGPETARLVMASGFGVELFKSTKEKIGDVLQQRRDYKEFEKNRLTRIRELQDIPKESEDIAPILPSSNVSSGAAILAQQSASNEGFQSDVLAEMQRSNQLFAEFLDELRDRKAQTLISSGESNLKKSPVFNLEKSIEEKSSGIMDTITNTIAGITGASLLRRIASPITKRLPNILSAGKNLIKSGPIKAIGKKILAITGAAGLATAAKKGIEPVVKTIGKAGEKALSKIGIKSAGKTTGKILAKKIPVFGAILGTGFAIDEAIRGNYIGAALEMASGIASTIPGPGTALSFAIDAAKMGMDMNAEAGGSEQQADVVNDRGQMVPPQPLPVPEVARGPMPSGTKGLLETLAHGEGTSDIKARRMGIKSGYDVSFAYGKYNPRGHKPISEMTIGEVKSLQRSMIRKQRMLGIPADNRSSAVGKYQLIQSTLQEQQQKLGLKDSDIFSPEVQDLIGTSLLRGRGLGKFMQGKLSAQAFQKNLSKEWASVANPDTGRSFYGQSVGTPTETIQSAISGVSKVPTSTAPSVPASNMGGLLSTVSTNNANLQTQMTARQLQPNAIALPMPAGGVGAVQSGPMPGAARPNIKPRAEEPYFYEMQKKALGSSIV